MLDAPLAIALSVGMHVTWNLIARHQPREAFPLWWVLLAHLLLLGPWGVYHLLTEAAWSPALLGLLLISALANAVYMFGLQQAYQHAPVALVYPVVRSSPLLIAIWSALLLEEALAVTTWLGIGVSVLGLIVLARSAGHVQDRYAIPWAVLAMLGTSVYSLSDKAAVASLPSLAAITGYISVGYALSWVTLSLALRRATGHWVPQRRIRTSALMVGGFCVGLAYVLIIEAMHTLPAAEVVAYSNAGIVFASLISLGVFGERTGWRQRLLGAVVISVGLFLIAYGR